MCMTCEYGASAGDMMTRLHICSDDNKPTTCCMMTDKLIELLAKNYDITKDDMFVIAYDFLKTMQNTAKYDNEIYFDEDWFKTDIIEYMQLRKIESLSKIDDTQFNNKMSLLSTTFLGSFRVRLATNTRNKQLSLRNKLYDIDVASGVYSSYKHSVIFYKAMQTLGIRQQSFVLSTKL